MIYSTVVVVSKLTKDGAELKDGLNPADDAFTPTPEQEAKGMTSDDVMSDLIAESLHHVEHHLDSIPGKFPVIDHIYMNERAKYNLDVDAARWRVTGEYTFDPENATVKEPPQGFQIPPFKTTVNGHVFEYTYAPLEFRPQKEGGRRRRGRGRRVTQRKRRVAHRKLKTRRGHLTSRRR